uniref:Uncharacterized protein n=1 Tax=Oryza rufipogon TaxID=4529 RepID=A0A0E0PUJ7_ORYRU
MPVLASDEEVAMPEQRSAAVVPVPPDRRGFIPLADWIRDLGAAFPHINLDSLVPPAPQPHPLVVREERPSPSLVAGLAVEEAREERPSPSLVAGLTVEEARKVAGEASGTGTVPYAEFLRLCCDASGAESGASVTCALDESGSVIVLGKTVFLRPEMSVFLSVAFD